MKYKRPGLTAIVTPLLLLPVWGKLHLQHKRWRTDGGAELEGLKAQVDSLSSSLFLCKVILQHNKSDLCHLLCFASSVLTCTVAWLKPLHMHVDKHTASITVHPLAAAGLKQTLDNKMVVLPQKQHIHQAACNCICCRRSACTLTLPLWEMSQDLSW